MARYYEVVVFGDEESGVSYNSKRILPYIMIFMWFLTIL